jgi:drug/metabolite transporter (DMT)-like permease
LSFEVLFVVLSAAVLHAGWNAIAKGGGGDPLARSFMLALGAAATAAPALLVTGLPAPQSWIYIAASALIHVVYFTLIGLAYRYGDYSVVYPLKRGGAPLFTTLLAAQIVGEELPVLAVSGIVLVCAGISGLGFDGLRRGGLGRNSILLSVFTSAIVVSYTLVDGVGVRLSGSSAAFLLAMMAATGLLLLPVVILFARGPMVSCSWTDWSRAAAGGAMANLSYGAALWAMTHAPIGMVAAVRETSVLFATLLAALVLKEQFGAARWLSAATVAIGLAAVRTGS